MYKSQLNAAGKKSHKILCKIYYHTSTMRCVFEDHYVNFFRDELKRERQL